jgi:hypothetical protein
MFLRNYQSGSTETPFSGEGMPRLAHLRAVGGHGKAAGDDQGHCGICRDSQRYALLLKAAENAIYKWRWISEKEESKELYMRFYQE